MKRAPWFAALVVVAVVAVFARALSHRFVLYDDDINVYQNELVNPPRPEKLAAIWGGPYMKLYIPATYSMWLGVAALARVAPGQGSQRAFAGLEPAPFHALNILLHAGNALLVLAILRRLVADDLGAGLGALLFALHPVQVEPVAWISGAKDLGSGCLALASLLLYLRSAGRRLEGRPWLAGYLIGFLLCALAILAKPSTIVVPLIAGALDLGLLRRRARTVLSALAPWLLLAVAGALAGKLLQPASAVSTGLSAWQRPLIAGDALAFYLRQLVVPLTLGPFYGRTPERVFESGAAWWGWTVPALLLVIAVAARKRSTVPLTALAVLVLGVAPVLGFVPFEFQHNSTTTDRYLYLALLGPALLSAWVIKARAGWRAYLVAALWLAALGLRSALQVPVWRDSRTLFEHAVAVDDRSDFAHGNLAEVLANAGELDAAVAHFREAVRLCPESSQNRLNLGSMLGQIGEIDGAVEHLEEAVRLDPDYAFARAALATGLAAQGRHALAVPHLREAVRLDPDFAPAHCQLGTLLELQGDASGAEAAYREALRMLPVQVEARVLLASLCARTGRLAEAEEHLRQALSSDPRNAEALAELGALLLNAGRPAEALPFLRRAAESRPDSAPLRAMLQAAERGGR